MNVRRLIIMTTVLGILLPGAASASPLDRSLMPIVEPTSIVRGDTSELCDRAVLGCVDLATGTIILEAGFAGKWTLFHELGHLVDWRLATDADHAWLASRLPNTNTVPWWGGDESDSEAFADAYALCATRSIKRRGYYTVGTEVLRGRGVARVCRYVRRNLFT